MRRRNLIIILTILIFSGCKILEKSPQQQPNKTVVNTPSLSQSVAIDTVTAIADTLTAQNKEELNTDTLDFLKVNAVDVRYDINDNVNKNFSSNLDSLVHLWYVKNSINSYADNSNDATTYETPTDSVYIKRLSKIPSIIPLSYNKIVKRYIELYTQKRQKQVEIMMGLSKYYFPLFEEILDKEGMPQELKYLPIIESALNPRAFSRAGASGLWQFMYGTGRIYKLDINTFVDERRDPVKSTYAAIKYLKDMYKIYRNWHLVIAAYNCGPGNVNKAIRRSGGKKNYWDIYFRLPRETRGYVPAFIAAVYTFNYYDAYNLQPKTNQLPVACDTLMINESLHFDQVADILNINKEQLRELNPQYRADIIPGDIKPYALKIPMKYTSDFIDKEDAIFAYKKDFYFSKRDKVVNPRDRYRKYVPVTPRGKAKIYYRVKPGDAVGLIAQRFHIRTADLRYWNNIRRNLIKVGQRLIVYVPKSKANYYKRIAKTSVKRKRASKPQIKPIYDKNYIYYTVRKGDNFWTIAKKYRGVSNYDIMRLNNITNANSLRVGQKLKIKRKG